MKKRKLRLKKNIKKWMMIFILILSIIFLTISIYKIIKYRLDENDTINQINYIQENIIINTIEDNEETQITIQDEIPKSNPYWDYISFDLIDVDFNELKKINNNVKGWIQVGGTNINYPFVQSTNNEYYLTHSFDKSYNSAGWVFLDYRNDISNINNKNTIIYAHSRLDKTMFGSLKNILKTDWLNDTDNHIIKMSTEYENSLWQVFSVYHIPTTSDYIQTDFNDENYKDFINIIKERSYYDFNTDVYGSDRILTLSTCYNNDEKMVLHAKLIKKEEKIS